MKFYFKIAIIFSLVFLGQTVLADTAKINKFRFSVDPDKTRLVLETTKVVSYVSTVFPDKITIEIKKAKLSAPFKKPVLSKTPVAAVVSLQNGNDLCLTLKLKTSVKLQHFTLVRPDRLVFDLYPAEKKEPKVVLKPPSSVSDSAKAVDDLEQRLIDKMAKLDAVNGVEEPSGIDESKKYLDQDKYGDKDQDKYQDEDQNKSFYSKKSDNDLRPITIVIDPGHGGHDSGAIGYGGTLEKKVNLAVAKALQKIINKKRGFRAILTRDSDYFIPLRRRLGIAHEKKADMFISIHADAYINREAHGVSIFALSQRGATSEAARWLADKENESELGQAISDKNMLLRSVLIDLAQTATISASLDIGGRVLQAVSQVASLHLAKVEQAGFMVLKSPDIPSLLVEVGFLTYGPEEKKLRDASYQEEIASRLAVGIQSYFMRRPPPGTYLAKLKPRRFTTLSDSLPTGNI